MKLNIILFSVLTIISIQAFGQKRGFISISAGPSMPVGQFGRNDLDFAKLFTGLTSLAGNPADPSGTGDPFGSAAKPPTSSLSFYGNNGFAKTGFQLAADGAFYFSKYIGITASAGYGQNGFDARPVQSLFYGISVIDSSIPKLTFSAKPYRYYTFMAGPTFGVKHERLSLDLRVMAGIAFTSYSKRDITIDISNLNQSGGSGGFFTMPQSILLSLGAEDGYGFLVSAGSTLRYSLTDKFAILVKPEFLWWQQTFKETFYLDAGFITLPVTEPSENKINITMINVGFGVAYQFNLK